MAEKAFRRATLASSIVDVIALRHSPSASSAPTHPPRGADNVLEWLGETDRVYADWAGHALAVVSVLTAVLFLAVRCGILR